MVRLSEENWHGKSLTAVPLRLMVGHAIQHEQNDARLNARTKLVPMVNFLGQLSVGVMAVAPIIGLVTRHRACLFTGVGLSGLLLRMLLHGDSPTEWDASFGKAMPILSRKLHT